jgi:hypothetical protein
VIESRVQGLLSGRPDNPITEAGLPSEMKYHGIRSRLGQRRADLKHQPLDLIIAGSGALIAVYALTRAITKNGRARRRAKRSLL